MKRWQTLVIGLAVSGIALYLSLRQADFGEMALALQQADFSLIGLAAALFILLVLVRGWRWSVLTQGRLSVMDGAWLFSVGFLFNNILPARIGEIARGVLAGRRERLHFSSAMSSIVVERLFDMIAIVVMFGVILIGLDLPTWATSAGATMGVGATVGLVALAIAAQRPEFALSLGSRIIAIVPRISEEQAYKFLEPFVDGLGGVSNWRTFGLGLFLSLLAWFMSGFVGWVLLVAFFGESPIVMGMLAIAAAGLGIAVPAAPSGLGAFHAAVIGALTAADYPGDAARSYAFVLHGLNFSMTTVLGIIGLLREGVSFGEVREAAMAAQTQAPEATSDDPVFETS